ncbi:MAG: beta-ketoacyl-ACP synthase 3 [Deinococcaceae bacterium]
MTIPIRITGLGKYLPSHRVSSEELEHALGLPKNWIFRRTGVIERRYATDETSAYMAAQAAKIALREANLSISDIDCIMGASAAPQQTIPCTAALVQREIGAPDGKSTCLDINSTCLSFLSALQIASLYLSHGIYKNVLIFSSELASVALNPREPESASLFGDGAAAVIVQSSVDSAYCGAAFQTHASGADLTRILGGGTLYPPNSPNTQPHMNLFEMNGPAIFKQATRLMGPLLDPFLKDIGWTSTDIDCVIPHQASRHALDQLTHRLGFKREQVYSNLETRGNCVAASIPLGLVEAYEQNRLKRGDKTLLIGTAAGLTLGMVGLVF